MKATAAAAADENFSISVAAFDAGALACCRRFSAREPRLEARRRLMARALVAAAAADCAFNVLLALPTVVDVWRRD